MRDIKKTIEAYRKMKHSKNEINLAEIMDLMRISESEQPGDIGTVAMNAIMFGYVVGYRAAKRDMKRKQKKQTEK